MENYDNIFEISEETVAAWLDGCLSSEEDLAFAERISSDFQLAEILDAYEDIESDFEHLIEDGYELPSELSFNFYIPETNIDSESSLFPMVTDSYFNHSDDIDSEQMAEDNGSVSESTEYYEDISDIQTEDFSFF